MMNMTLIAQAIKEYRNNEDVSQLFLSLVKAGADSAQVAQALDMAKAPMVVLCASEDNGNIWEAREEFKEAGFTLMAGDIRFWKADIDKVSHIPEFEYEIMT